MEKGTLERRLLDLTRENEDLRAQVAEGRKTVAVLIGAQEIAQSMIASVQEELRKERAGRRRLVRTRDEQAEPNGDADRTPVEDELEQLEQDQWYQKSSRRRDSKGEGDGKGLKRSLCKQRRIG